VVLAAAVFYFTGLRVAWAPTPQLSSGVREASLEYGGHTRTHLLYVPQRRRPNPPLVLVLHGSLSSGAEMRRMNAYEFDTLADEHGFVVAYPDAYEGIWNACRKSINPPSRQDGIDDVGYLNALIDHLAASEGIDPHKVFATGYSNGGAIAMRLALETPQRLAGLAVVAMNLPPDDNSLCEKSDVPVPFLLINGSDDPIIPDAGGSVTLFGFDRGRVQSSEATVDYFRALAGHPKAPQVETLPDTVSDDGSTIERRTWRRLGRPEVVHYVVHGGGHATPHPVVRLSPFVVGATNADVSGPQEIWSFFARVLMAPPA